MILLSLFLFAVQTSHAIAPPEFLSPDKKLDAVESIYTSKMISLLNNWPPKKKFVLDSKTGPVGIRCISTPGNNTYVGIEQWMEIKAPLSVVKSILDDFSNYKNLFSGFDDVKVISRDPNLHQLILYWEQHIPILPNISYEMAYLFGALGKNRYYYRYQLHEGRSIKFSDGIIVIETTPQNTTMYTEYDFFDANWGALSLSTDRIWKESVEGIFLSDIAIKLKAENPKLSYDDIRTESKKVLEKFPVEPAIRARSPW